MGDPRTDRRTHNPGLRRIDEPLAPSSTSRYPLISGERKWKRSIRWVGATSASARPGCSKLGGSARMPSLPPPPLAISGHHPTGFAQPGPRTRCYGNTPRPASGVSCSTAASWPFQLVEPWPSTASCAAFSTLQSSSSTRPTTGVPAPVHRGTCQADLKRRGRSDAGNCRAHEAAAQLNAQGFADVINIIVIASRPKRDESHVCPKRLSEVTLTSLL
jgi:hypothetical protein